MSKNAVSATQYSGKIRIARRTAYGPRLGSRSPDTSRSMNGLPITYPDTAKNSQTPVAAVMMITSYQRSANGRTSRPPRK